MEKKEILEAIKELRKEPKKKFNQSIDFQVKLQNIDLKKQENKVDIFVALPNTIGRKITVCGLVGGSLYNDAKSFCDKVISQEEFKNIAGNGKELKKLARAYDYFIAQADIMGSIATTFGRYLGPKGRMPNPKAGAVIPPKGTVKPVVDKLQKTIRLIAKNNETAVRTPIGKENMTDDEIADNIVMAYTSLVNALPLHEQNIKTVQIKMTMSKPVIVGGKK